MEKKIRYTLCIHTGAVKKTPTKYDLRYHNPLWLRDNDPNYSPKYAKYYRNVNFAGTRTVSCCGVFELTNIESGSFRWGPLKTESARLTAFNNFLKDVSKDHGGLVVYLLPVQQDSLFGKFVREEFLEIGIFWNPKTRNTLRGYYKILNTQAPPLRVFNTFN